MAKYIVFEETGEVRPPKRGEAFTDGNGGIEVSAFDYDTIKFPILHRLTDAEVDALVAAKPADDERERFVADKAGLILAAMYANGEWIHDYLAGNIRDWPDVAKEAAESLAARLFGERTK